MKTDRSRSAHRPRSRPNLTESQARAMLGRLATSRKPITVFAEEEKVSPQCVHYWKLKLQRGSQAAPQSSASGPTFIQLVPAPEVSSRQPSRDPRDESPFVLHTPDGCRLSIPRDASEDSLRRVFRALKEAP